MDKNKEKTGGIRIRLNLIPPDKKEEIRKSHWLKEVIKAEVVLTSILFVFAITLLFFLYVLNMELNAQIVLNNEMERTNQFDKIKNYDKQFSEANEQIKQIAVIDKAQLYWSGIFSKLSEIVPSGITVKSVVTKDYELTISGVSDTRDNLLSFKDNLEKEDCFSEVNLPLSSLVNKNDVEFQIVFKVDQNCLKKVNN